MSFPLRARSSEPESVSGGDPEPDPDPDPDPKLAGELCPVLTEGALVAPESCDLPAEAASSSREPALLTVLGGDVRLEDLVLPQAPEGTAAGGGGGLFGLSLPVVALAGGGGVLAIAVLASGGSDGGGGSGGGAMNVAPVTTTDALATLSAMEGVAASWEASSWFTDPDGDTLTYAVSGNPGWLTLDAMTGTLTIAAMDEAEVGTYTLAITATDDSADRASITHTVTLTITDNPADGTTPDPDSDPGPGPDSMSGSNSAPVTTAAAVASAMLTADEGEAMTWDIAAWFSDPDAGDTLTFTATGLPSWLGLDAAMGELAIAEAATDDDQVAASPYTFTITASDGTANTSHMVTLAVANVNDAPTTTAAAPVAPAAPATATEGEAASWDIAAWFTDPDAGDTLTFTATGNPAWLVFDAAMGELTIAAGATDDADVGSYTVVLTASDAAAATAVLTATLTVENANEAPTTTTLATTSLTVDEGVAMTWNVVAWFSDPDAGDTLTYAATGNPAWLGLDGATGELTIEADATDDADVGPHTLEVTATDAGALRTVHTATLTIANVNEAPTTTTLAATSLTVDEGVAITWNVAAWFSDPDTGDTLTYTGIFLELDGLFRTEIDLPDWLELNATKGELTIQADATDNADIGTYTLEITATDGDDETKIHTATLTVEPVAEAPVVVTEGDSGAPATVTAMEGGAAQSFTVSDWFTDPDGDALTFALGTGGSDSRVPAWATFNTAMGVLSLAFGDTDDADIGTYTVVVTASDTTEPTALETSHTVTLVVLNTNDAPVVVTTGDSAALATLTAMEGSATAVSWDVSTWFSDEDTNPHSTSPDVLTYTVAALPDWLELDGATGALTIAAFATDDSEIGTYTLAVTASDLDGATAVHTTTLTITDTENDPRFVGTVSNRIAPITGMTIELDLAGFFTDLQNDGNTPGTLILTVSDSIDDTMTDENIITAVLTDTTLTLTPGEASGPRPSGELWKQETVSITATDSDGNMSAASFAVTTRANILDVHALTPARGFVLQGDVGGDKLGSSVSGAGDINGDGLADLIVGANEGDDGGRDAGEAYIVYGKAGTQFGTVRNGRQVLDTTNLAPADGFIIQGDAADDELGTSVSGAGDVNGDGLADLIVGASEGGDIGTAAGEAYIVYGKAGPGDGSQFGTAMNDRQVLDIGNLTPGAGFIIQGEMSLDHLGISVSGTGDVNGDGLGDLVVGARQGDDGGDDAGEAYVVYGKAGTGSQFGMLDRGRQILDTRKLAPADGFIIQGDIDEDRLGMSVSGAGDINGDGLGDLIVGAHFGDDGGAAAGEAYVVYGKAGTDGTQFGSPMTNPLPTGGMVRQVVDTTDLAPAAGFIIQGDMGGEMDVETKGDQLGWSVSGAGDVNGDGLDDLIVGAYQGNDGGGNAGEAYVVYGKAGTDGTQFGTAVRIQLVEVMEGQPTSGTAAITTTMTTTLTDEDTPAEGSMVVVRQVLDTSMLAPADGFILQGDARVDLLGYSVSGAGDVNGDGLDDLIAGAYWSNDGGHRAGEASIIYGKAGTDGSQFGTTVRTDANGMTIASDDTMTDGWVDRQVLDTTGLAPTDGFLLRGDRASDQLGSSVSGAGDINGDGFDDLIAGAFEGNDGGREAGEAYIVYGGTHLGEVISHAQTLTGAASESFLYGGAGSDTLEGHADTEVLYGGAGDDTLELADASFRRVDGGSGSDTLVLAASLTLDLTEAAVRGRVRSIEAVSLSDASAAVTLDLVSVYALVGSRDNGGDLTAPGEAFLRLEGSSGMVALVGTWTTMTMADGEPDLYEQASAKLLIDDGLVA